MFSVAERCGVIPISCLKLVSCEPNVGLRSVIVFVYGSGLVNDQ